MKLIEIRVIVLCSKPLAEILPWLPRHQQHSLHTSYLTFQVITLWNRALISSRNQVYSEGSRRNSRLVILSNLKHVARQNDR